MHSICTVTINDNTTYLRKTRIILGDDKIMYFIHKPIYACFYFEYPFFLLIFFPVGLCFQLVLHLLTFYIKSAYCPHVFLRRLIASSCLFLDAQMLQCLFLTRMQCKTSAWTPSSEEPWSTFSELTAITSEPCIQ